MDDIGSAATRMSRLVQDLLNYSRMSRAEIVLEPVGVLNSVREALQELGEPPERLKLDIDDSLAVIAHRATLTQVLANLIANAMKFHQRDRRAEVTIRAIRDGAYLKIEVQDTGIGIDTKYLDRIFKVFERLHGADEFPGTGIGLAIVQRGIERMSGTVEVASTLGLGTTFTITLPAAEAEG